MTKLELIEKIINRITDPWTESCEDYKYAELIDKDTAKDIINQCREEDEDFDPEDRLPEEVTPELMMIAYNCNVRKNKHELKVRNLAKAIADYDLVCEYSNYYLPDHNDAIDIIPTDFLMGYGSFPFDRENSLSPSDLICIGLNSAKVFNSNHEYCWYDKNTMTLHSTDEPFRDGTLNPGAFAEYLLSPEGEDGLNYIVNEIIDDDDFIETFGCTKEEFMKEE